MGPARWAWLVLVCTRACARVYNLLFVPVLGQEVPRLLNTQGIKHWVRDRGTEKEKAGRACRAAHGAALPWPAGGREGPALCAAFVSRAEDLRQPRDTRGQPGASRPGAREDQQGSPRDQLSLGWGHRGWPQRGGVWGRHLAILTTSTVPPIKMNSLVMISTISRTCEGGVR